MYGDFERGREVASLSTTNPTRAGPGSNPVLHGSRLAGSCRSACEVFGSGTQVQVGRFVLVRRSRKSAHNSHKEAHAMYFL